MKLPMMLLSLGMAGALMAQFGPPSQYENDAANGSSTQQVTAEGSAHDRAMNRSERMVRRLDKRLDLTAQQRKQVRSIFADSRAEAKAMAPQLKAERMALKAAVKSDNLSQIDRIVQQNQQLNSRVEAIHVKAMAKVYAILTPQQQTKFDHMDVHRLTSGIHHRGARNADNS